jgi:hypothetical protein
MVPLLHGLVLATRVADGCVLLFHFGWRAVVMAGKAGERVFLAFRLVAEIWGPT